MIVYVDDQGNHRAGLIDQVWDIESGEAGIVVFKPRKAPAEYISNVFFDAAGKPHSWHWHTPKYAMTYEGAVG